MGRISGWLRSYKRCTWACSGNCCPETARCPVGKTGPAPGAKKKKPYASFSGKLPASGVCRNRNKSKTIFSTAAATCGISGRPFPENITIRCSCLPSGTAAYTGLFRQRQASRNSRLMRLRSCARLNFFFGADTQMRTGETSPAGLDASRKTARRGKRECAFPEWKSAFKSFSRLRRSWAPSVFRIANKATEAYFRRRSSDTLSLWRPLARREASTLRPLAVCIRLRKP